MPEPMLELKGVSVQFGSFLALRKVSVSVAEGEIVVLLGANGAGKSTLFRAVSGLERPSEGTIYFDGQDMSRLPAHRIVREGVAHAPEGKHLFTEASVRKNLLLGAYVRRRDPAGVEASMDEVFDLFPMLRTKAGDAAGTLSGGQQQMLSIGRALMARPRLLLLDEPSLGLAPLVVEEVFESILEINRRGTAVFLAEQNAHAALKVAQRGYVIESGSVALEGDRDTLVDNPEVRRAYIGV
jgi:branched-chain amino acid transport system ATP-binding protein|tara:strand:- start:543 stop:1262 length:720 start_codon:yes stop_codon:yes gene_type:complete